VKPGLLNVETMVQFLHFLKPFVYRIEFIEQAASEQAAEKTDRRTSKAEELVVNSDPCGSLFTN